MVVRFDNIGRFVDHHCILMENI